MDQFPRRLSDGGEDSGGQGERGDRGDMGREELSGEPQDYVVVPEQPWLDGFCVEKGLIPAVRGDAVGRGLHGGGTVGPEKRSTAGCRLLSTP